MEKQRKRASRKGFQPVQSISLNKIAAGKRTGKLIKKNLEM